MNVSLTPYLEEFIKEKVKSGLYNSSSEVVREALRLLEKQDRIREIRLQDLRKEIQIGIDQIERGESTEYNEDTLKEFFDNIRARCKQRLESKRQSGD